MSISVKDITVSIGAARSERFNIQISGANFSLCNFSMTERMLDHCRLSFNLVKYPDESISDIQFLACSDIIGKEVTLALETDNMENDIQGFTSGDQNADIEFSGFVVNATAMRNSNAQYVIHVEAVSWDGLLDDNPDCLSWENKQEKDIIESQLARAANLQFQVDPAFTVEPYEYCCKWNETTWGFICRMAIRHGEWLFNDGRKLYFGKLPEKDPVRLSYPSRDITSYGINMDVKHLRFVKITSEADDFGFWDDEALPKMEDVLNPLNEAAFNASKDIFKETTLENALTSGFNWHKNGGYTLQRYFDRPQATGRKAGLLTYHGFTSCSKLSVGSKLTIVDNYITDNMANSKSDVPQDEILITQISHSFSNDETYDNSFSGISANAKHPPYTNASAHPRAFSCRAFVYDNDDPERKGRIRVCFPWGAGVCEDYNREMMITPWIKVEQAYASLNRGAYIIPEQFDEVMVDFEGGNAELPYVRSSLYSNISYPDKEKWATDNDVPKNQVKAIRTRNGHTIEIHDEGENGYIRIYDYKKENYILTYSTDEKLIKLESTGNIELYAKNDIIMNAGRNIKSTAGKDIIDEAGHDNHINVGNDYNLEVGHDIYTQASNEHTSHSDARMMFDTSSEMYIYAWEDMYQTTEADYNVNVGGNMKESLSKNLSIDVGNNTDMAVTNNLEVAAMNVNLQAQDKMNQYSVTHQMNATNSMTISATTSIDVKALVIKEN